MLARLIDSLKPEGITALFGSLTSGSHGGRLESTDVAISSLIDTWLLLRDIELNGERNRGMYIIKSRGKFHSNQFGEFVLSPSGVDLKDVYVGPSGAARLRELDPDVGILFISGYAADADELPRSSSGELCFLAKPFQADEFLN